MSPSDLQWFRFRWPRDVPLDRLHAISLLLAATAGTPVVLEVVGRGGAIEHRLGLRHIHAGVARQLQVVVPGLAVTDLESRPAFEGDAGVELRFTSNQRMLRIDHAELSSRALLTALSHTRRTEAMVLQWQLVGALPPQSVASGAEHAEPLPMSASDILLGRRGRLDGEASAALRTKRALPVWRSVGRGAVKAATPTRRQMLLRELVAALRLTDAPGIHAVAKRCTPARVDRPARSWLAPCRLNSSEIIAVCGWPVGTTVGIPVDHSQTLLLPPTKRIPSTGRVVGASTFPSSPRPVALSSTDGLRHVHVLGPTGTGKSTLLLNLIAQDVAAGRSVVVLEPKGDLIRDVLERIPADRIDDIVVIDPSDDRPVGLNPLAKNGRSPELVADELLGMFRRMYESSWGPRTNDVLGASLLTLARTPDMTLCALPALLLDPVFRHRIVSELNDPVGLEPFWFAYENWSEAERLAAIAPSLNRIRPFLMRPQLRAVLGQAQPRFDLSEVFTERKVLLVNLAKGVLGSEASSLLGSLFLGQLWAAALRRTHIPPDRRRHTFVYVDEVQDYLRLPTDVGEALVQARGLGVGFVLAHQHLSQLDPATRSAVLTNARSRICFQLAPEDARVMASDPPAPTDFLELPVFEIYAQLVAEGAVQPWCSAKTLPPPTRLSEVSQVLSESRERYGVDRRVVDADIERLLSAARSDASDLAPRRRADRGTP